MKVLKQKYKSTIVRKLNTQISTTTKTTKQNKHKKNLWNSLTGDGLSTFILPLHFPKIAKVIVCYVFCYTESDLILTNVGRQWKEQGFYQ